jgi:hypothetical protein
MHEQKIGPLAALARTGGIGRSRHDNVSDIQNSFCVKPIEASLSHMSGYFSSVRCPIAIPS